MLFLARSFFSERSILEIDCSPLVPFAPIDANIDVITAQVTETQVGYLHTSPEYSLKKLLAEGFDDLYYLGAVFRQGEIGPRHNPSFTMAEWYRLGFSFEEMMEETCEFIELFLGERPRRILSYKKAFELYVGIDPETASLEELEKKAAPFATPNAVLDWSRDTYLDLLLTHLIEPNLGQGNLTLLIDYPKNQAALACVVKKEGSLVAERFEIYANGVELANGYHELANPEELRSRFETQNKERLAVGKEAYELDEAFLAAQEHLPSCCGVSVGFDRVFMLRHQVKSLHDILPFSWNNFN